MSHDSNLDPSDIEDIFDVRTITDDGLQVWITVAEERVGDLPEHPGLTDDRKTKIVRFLAPALATAQDPRVDREQHESATVSYGGERMSYHDVAAMLDPTGTLGGDGDVATVDVPNARSYGDRR